MSWSRTVERSNSGRLDICTAVNIPIFALTSVAELITPPARGYMTVGDVDAHKPEALAKAFAGAF